MLLNRFDGGVGPVILLSFLDKVLSFCGDSHYFGPETRPIIAISIQGLIIVHAQSAKVY